MTRIKIGRESQRKTHNEAGQNRRGATSFNNGFGAMMRYFSMGMKEDHFTAFAHSRIIRQLAIHDLFPSAQIKPRSEEAIECRERLGGLLKYYHRPAA